MNTLLFIIIFVVMFFAVVGLSWYVDRLYKRIKQMRKPITKLNIDDPMEVLHILNNATLEFKLLALQTLLGTTDVLIHVEKGGVSIKQAAEDWQVHDKDNAKSYTG